jgi:hypothetical protein
MPLTSSGAILAAAMHIETSWTIASDGSSS